MTNADRQYVAAWADCEGDCAIDWVVWGGGYESVADFEADFIASYGLKGGARFMTLADYQSEAK